MRKIIITESQYRYIMENGMYAIDPEKVKIIVKYLNRHFKKASIESMGSDGYPSQVPIVTLIGFDGSPLRNMTAKQLFYYLQDKYQHIYSNPDKRDRFLKQVIKDWYSSRVSKNGLLSTNLY